MTWMEEFMFSPNKGRWISRCRCGWDVSTHLLGSLVRVTAYHLLVNHDQRHLAYLLEEIPRERTIFDPLGDAYRFTEGKDG